MEELHDELEQFELAQKYNEEDVKDNWEDSDEEEEVKKVVAPKPVSKKKPTTTTTTTQKKESKEVKDLSEKEKKAVIEESEKRALNDLLGGEEKQCQPIIKYVVEKSDDFDILNDEDLKKILYKVGEKIKAKGLQKGNNFGEIMKHFLMNTIKEVPVSVPTRLGEVCKQIAADMKEEHKKALRNKAAKEKPTLAGAKGKNKETLMDDYDYYMGSGGRATEDDFM